MTGTPVGRVLGTEDATPLEFWVALAEGQYLQLDDVVVCERAVPGREDPVQLSGIVTQVRARHEGARFDSDVFLIEDGLLPAEAVEAAQVLTTRVEPEVFVPPAPGSEVRRAFGKERDQALYFDRMEKLLPIGIGRDGAPLYANLEFVDGTRGAHVNISGISGVATKTTYATFLLYSLFNSGVLGDEATNTHALIFNVKGEDLLFLDHDNVRLDDVQRDRYRSIGLVPGAFKSVEVYAPPRPGDPIAAPDVATRSQGVSSFYWTIADFVEGDLLPFVFADAEDDRQQYTMVVHNVAAALSRNGERADDGAWRIVGGAMLRTYRELVDFVMTKVNDDVTRAEWAGSATGLGTINAFIRRLLSSQRALERVVRADIPERPRHRIETDGAQVTVVDLHNLPDRAKRFVVGVTLRGAFERKEQTGSAKPLLFVVLDELNKYAPRDGESPIKEILLDVAERGRSMGIVLIGAQQTASEVERRIIANSSIRVVGRLDAAEADATRVRLPARNPPEAGDDREARHDVRDATGDPGAARRRVPVPGVGDATVRAGPREPGRDRSGRPSGRPVRRPARRVVKILHTSDWHVGKTLRGESRLDEHRAVLAEIAGIAAAEAVDLVLVTGDLFESAAPLPEAQRVVWDALLALRAGGAQMVAIGGNHDNQPAFDAWSPLFAAAGITVLGHAARPEHGGVVELTTGDGTPVVVVLVPFVSQRFAVRAEQLLELDAAAASGLYTERMRLLIEALCRSFRPDAVNLLALHGFVRGGKLGGGERNAHTIFEYGIEAAHFPVNANYVALGHLHRTQRLAAPAPTWYAGSPIQVDFGESDDTKGVLVVETAPGVPARVEVHPLSTPWQLRTIRGTLAELEQRAKSVGDAWLRVFVHEPVRAGLADEVRALLPRAVDVTLEPAAETDAAAPRRTRRGRSRATSSRSTSRDATSTIRGCSRCSSACTTKCSRKQPADATARAAHRGFRRVP